MSLQYSVDMDTFLRLAFDDHSIAVLRSIEKQQQAPEQQQPYDGGANEPTVDVPELTEPFFFAPTVSSSEANEPLVTSTNELNGGVFKYASGKRNHIDASFPCYDMQDPKPLSLLGNPNPAKKARTESPPTELTFSNANPDRFRDYQADQWTEKFQELCNYKTKHGHTHVPNVYEPNQPLAHWTKRQRYQYKLKAEGKIATMTDDRIIALNALGFVWNAHEASWEQRLEALKKFAKENGHMNVPSHYPEDQQLSTWVKCQRRQYKLLVTGRKTNMTRDRVHRLSNLGFQWELRVIKSRIEA